MKFLAGVQMILGLSALATLGYMLAKIASL